jgi:hypothetical protein
MKRQKGDGKVQVRSEVEVGCPGRLAHSLFLTGVIKDLDDLLDSLIRRQLVASHSDADRVVQEGACQSPHRLGPRRGD